jgi:hypothetical protein
MAYRLLADLVLVLHLAFVLFVALGGLLALRWRRAAWVHLPAASWGAVVMFTGWICPLTPFEKELRGLGGEAGYPGGFVEHYVVSLLYPAGLTRGVQVALGLGVILLNVAVYRRVLATRRQAVPD